MKIINNLYLCTNCVLFRPKSDFHKKLRKHDNIRMPCKICRKIERAKRYIDSQDKELEYGKNYKLKNPEKRKNTANKCARKRYNAFRELLNNFKNVPCLDCNKSYPPAAMDFDHRNPEDKLFNVSESCGKHNYLIVIEIAKCDIVCANCHRKREHNRRHKTLSYVNRLINKYKSVPCNDCKIQLEYYQMDFDHRNPKEKLFHISKPPRLDKKLILDEINKCDVICANCHRIRTFSK